MQKPQENRGYWDTKKVNKIELSIQKVFFHIDSGYPVFCYWKTLNILSNERFENEMVRLKGLILINTFEHKLSMNWELTGHKCLRISRTTSDSFVCSEAEVQQVSQLTWMTAVRSRRVVQNDYTGEITVHHRKVFNITTQVECTMLQRAKGTEGSKNDRDKSITTVPIEGGVRMWHGSRGYQHCFPFLTALKSGHHKSEKSAKKKLGAQRWINKAKRGRSSYCFLLEARKLLLLNRH